MVAGSDTNGQMNGINPTTVCDRCAGMTEEEIIALSMKFGEEMKRRGLRTVWDPRAVIKLDVK